jgi:hypothetical protein
MGRKLMFTGAKEDEEETKSLGRTAGESFVSSKDRK